MISNYPYLFNVDMEELDKVISNYPYLFNVDIEELDKVII